MNIDTLALKYRPTKLSDLIGQESVVTTLTNAFNSKNLYPCYLFSGSFGCGKTSSARILAAMENCEKGPTLEPCGECSNCKEIFSGESMDIREINAASTNGIEDIRNIIDYVRTSPLKAKTKYVILDECHALSKQAVESSLKILEEPPEHVRFILCTTDSHKIKGTIQSRGMPFRFSKVHWAEITNYLKTICEKEGFKAEEGALRIAAKLSDGSVRNSLRNLQLIKNFAGDNPLSVDIAQRALGAVSDAQWFDLIDAIVGKNVPAAMLILQDTLNKGVDVEQVLHGLTDHLRNLLLLTTCKDPGGNGQTINVSGLVYFNQEEKQRYIHQLEKITADLISEMITMLYEIHRGITVNMNPQVLLENYIIKSIQTHSEIQKKIIQKQ